MGTGALDGLLNPDLSARQVLSRRQAETLAAALAIMGAGIALAPMTALLVLVIGWSALCALIALQQLAVSVTGLRHPIAPVSEFPLADAELPAYTVLVPLFREAVVVAGLIRALEALDYPPQLLDVKLLVEAEDSETAAALEGLELGPQFEVLEVPPGRPQTKPRACNFGLAQARGELVVIFDAEDRPDHDQLRKAAAAFHAAGPDVACFQARLAFWNPTTNLLTRYCTAEYCAIFDVTRPGLERVGGPIPLGGTSNHFPVGLLRELGAWDPFNVTEDADLGMRLARAGYRTRLLDSTTLEEANSRTGNWIRQQSRWIKGYVQTWLVHVRHPQRLGAELGTRGTVHLHLTLLAPVVPILLAPLGWGVTLVWALWSIGAIAPMLPPWLLEASSVSFILGTFAGIGVWAAALRRCGHPGIVPYCFVFPFHQLIKSVAAIKAMIQLVTRPSYWEKTAHGLDGDPANVPPLAVRGSTSSV